MTARLKRSAAYDSAYRVLKPLLRVLFALGLSEHELDEICRGLAEKYRKERGRPRLASLPYRASLEDVVARWKTDPSFLEGSRPALLRYAGKNSFSSLVRLSAKRVKVAEILTELRRHKLVSKARDGRLRLICPYFPVRTAGAIDLELFTKMTVDFLRTHEVNFLRHPPRGEGLFQRTAHRSTSNPKLAAEFNRYAREQGQLLLEAVDDWLARHDDGTVRPGTGSRARVGLGVYVVNETLR